MAVKVVKILYTCIFYRWKQFNVEMKWLLKKIKQQGTTFYIWRLVRNSAVKQALYILYLFFWVVWRYCDPEAHVVLVFFDLQ